jgi:putative membrane protein
MTTTQFLFSAWSWNPVVLGAAGAGLALYLLAFGRKGRIGWFLLALVFFLLTLVSPINALADGYLFSAHMLQHILLLLAVPGFVLLSLPRSFSLTARPRWLAHPFVGWMAGVGAMWFWHWPTLCNAAVTSRPVYLVQTVSLLVCGTIFWSQVIAPRQADRLSPPGAVLYLFSACVACSALGMILTFSPVTVCSIYAIPVGDRLGMWDTIHTGWGFTPDKDQQVGGLLMWVPMCLVYLGAIFAQIARWFGEVPAPRPVTQ